MADQPVTDAIFGEPGSLLSEAWMDYFLARTPQERLRADVRIWAFQSLNRQLSDRRRFVVISGI